MVQSVSITKITESELLTLGSDTYIIDATLGNITITLPDVVSDGIHFKLIRIDSSPNVVNIVGEGAELIDGELEKILVIKTILELNSFEDQWYSIANSSLTRSFSKTLFTTSLIQNNGSPYVSFYGSNYTNQVVCSFLYVGANAEPITKFSIVAMSDSGTPDATIYLVNLVGNEIITSLSLTGITDISQIFSSTTIANLPTDPGIIEVRIKFNTGTSSDKVNLSSLIVQ